jgi:hypothetical protein
MGDVTMTTGGEEGEMSASTSGSPSKHKPTNQGTPRATKRGLFIFCCGGIVSLNILQFLRLKYCGYYGQMPKHQSILCF